MLFGLFRRRRNGGVNRNPISPTGIQAAGQNRATSYGAGGSGAQQPVTLGDARRLQLPRRKGRSL